MKALKILFSLAMTLFMTSMVAMATGTTDHLTEWFIGGTLVSQFIKLPVGVLPALSLGQGFAPYLLTSVSNVFGISNPEKKLTPKGFLNFLKRQDTPEVLRLNTNGGHRKSVRVKYKQRLTSDFVATSKSCDNVLTVPNAELDVDLSSTRQIPFYLEDETVAKMMEDASNNLAVGNPATPMMAELVDIISMGANAIMNAVDVDLATIAAANVGVNKATGSAAAQTININKDGAVNPLTDGLTKMLSDYALNEANGTPQIVGSGLFHNFALQQGAISANQSGLNVAQLASQFTWDYDVNFESALGTNQVIMYEPNAVQLVEYLEYTGFKAGDGLGLGDSIFGTIDLPIMTGNGDASVAFDWQLRRITCPTTFTDGYYGTTATYEKGWQFILSKQCGLFTVSDQAYRGTDPLNGNRGSYRYTISNNCETCS